MNTIYIYVVSFSFPEKREQFDFVLVDSNKKTNIAMSCREMKTIDNKIEKIMMILQ